MAAAPNGQTPQAPLVENSCNIRWSWNKFPANKIDASRTVVPLGCLYTPLARSDVMSLPYQPMKCVCGAVLNPHCSIDFRSKTWACVVCGNRNNFPAHYANHMSENQLPRELTPNVDTMEYVLPQEQAAPAGQQFGGAPAPTNNNSTKTTFAFVIDTCLDEEDLVALREYLLFTLTKVPENVNVCFITFGATVQIHELKSKGDFSRSLVLRGTQEPTPALLKSMIKDPSSFVVPMEDAEFAITALVEDLQRDLWPVPKNHRAMRATGAAIATAAALLELVAKGTGSLILPFISGVCTEGPGKIAEIDRSVLIRTHTDVRDGTPSAKYVDKAQAFYDELMRKLVTNGHSLSLIVASLDQAGTAEMKLCAQATGGAVISTDLWSRPWIRSSMANFLATSPSTGALQLGLNATFDIMTSPTWKVMGVIGPCIGTGKRSACVAESEFGMGGTCQWTTACMDYSTTLSAYFEAANAPQQQNQAGGAKPPAPPRFVQFITKYQHPNGGERIRVTTIKHAVQETTNFPELAASFDQQTAAVLMARIAVQKTDNTPLFDVLRWLDRHTIRLVSRFGEYTKDQPSSLRLNPALSLFPAFMYHLRRSSYLSIFNNSPDETAVLRLLLLKANCADSIVMIQPTLTAYSMSGQPPMPVPLEETSLVADGQLVFDTYFEVLVIRGDTVDGWMKQGYHDEPEYAHFKQFLETTRVDAQAIANGRYLTPRYFEVGRLDGNFRIWKNRVNPGKGSQNNGGYASGGTEELVYTDDAPLQKFMEHLKKLAVQQ